MVENELKFEEKRLSETIVLAKKLLSKARRENDEYKEEVISAKQELRENTVHSVGSLWGSDGFEALAEMSQYVNPVTDKIAQVEATENRIAMLEKTIKSPYFARIDFKFDDEEEEDVFEKIYIGRSSLMEDDLYVMYVYDWRSPIASMFYRFMTGLAFYDAPDGRITGEINLKRQYEISNGELEYFFDADVQIIDEFLRKLLSKNASSKMKAIVETIQKEQDIVIRDMENDLMMVQGVAGSGKTSIALHRAAYLMYQGLSSKLSADNIMIISPNSLFEQYISQVLPELGEDNIVSVVFEDMLAEILRTKHIQSRNQFLEKLITSVNYRNVMKNSIEFKTSHMFLEILNRFIEDLPYKWIDFEDICYKGNCIMSKDEMQEKILTGRKRTPLGIRLKQLEDFILEALRNSKKERIKKSDYQLIKKEIQKFTEPNIKHLYEKLFSDKEYFYSLSMEVADNTIPDYMDDILEYTKENLYNHFLYYDDAVALIFLNLRINGCNKYKNIKQLVIDEAQDYYPLHYETFNLLFPNAKYTILGDINQTLEKQEDLSIYDRIKRILNKNKSSLVTMDKSFRCTNEILEYSLQFIEHRPEIKSFNRNGEKPKVHISNEQTDFNKMIISEVKNCLDKGYQSVGLICKTQKNSQCLFDNLKSGIDIQLINNEGSANLQGVFIIPVYMSKGLEFDAVLICDASIENYNSKDDKKLLYIACTRALHRLNLFCKGTVSSLIQNV